MELESKITLNNKAEIKPVALSYDLSGMGGSGKLLLTKGFDSSGKYCIHVKCEAGIKGILKIFNFEGLSFWEVEAGDLRFLSFEEKDRIKNIYKKWEFSAGQLQYVENKKGLVSEREISYSLNGLSPEHRAFDPLSIVALIHLEKNNLDEKKSIYVFGKQQLLKIDLQIAKDNTIKIIPQGLSLKWENTLKESEIKINENGYIQEITIPSPFYVGKIQMKLTSTKHIGPADVDAVSKLFLK